MLDREPRARWHAHPLPGDLDGEFTTGLDGICEAAQLGRKARSSISLFDVSSAFLRHFLLL